MHLLIITDKEVNHSTTILVHIIMLHTRDSLRLKAWPGAEDALLASAQRNMSNFVSRVGEAFFPFSFWIRGLNKTLMAILTSE